MLLKFKVENQSIKLIETTPLVSGTVNDYKCQFEFDESWEGFTKTAVFTIFEGFSLCEREEQSSIVILENDRCIIPASVLKEGVRLKIGVFGTKDEVQRPTVYTPNLLVRTGAVPSDNIPVPEPNIYLQIIQIMEDTKAIAQSVRDDADAGKFDGKDGEKGDKGDPGVYVGEKPVPKGTRVQVNPKGDSIIIPEVMQETGSSIVDTMSQDAITKELDDKQPVGDYATKTDIPSTLPNPYKLNLIGAVSASYDGSSEVNVEIPQGGSEQVQSDWNQNDSSKPDYVKNRICYEELRTVQFYGEKTITFGPEGTYEEIELVTPMESGKEYIVKFNEDVYKGVAVGSSTDAILSLPVADIYTGLEGFYIESTTFMNVSVSLNITSETKFTQKIDSKYLPDIKLTIPVATSTTLGGIKADPKTIEDTVPVNIDNDNKLWANPGVGRKGTGVGAEIFNNYEGNKASGEYAHAEGSDTFAQENYSHTEGANTLTLGTCSHAEGLNTYAFGAYQHVQGAYNIGDSSSKYLHIVGNGDASSGVQSNAHTLDWDGNSWYQGSVLVGGADMDAPDAELNPDSVVIKSSTPGSVKRFKITVTDDGVIKATAL